MLHNFLFESLFYWQVHNGNPSQNYGVWDHVASGTCHPTQANTPRLNPSQWRLVLDLPTPGGINGWVDLGGWWHTEMVYPQTVTHPSINRARRRVTTLIETNALPLSQATTCRCEESQRVIRQRLETPRNKRSNSNFHVGLNCDTLVSWEV